MFKTPFVCIFCTIIFLISGCVSKLQYLELEEEFYVSQQQLEEEKSKLEGQKRKLEEQKRKMDILNEKRRHLEANIKKCDKIVLDFRAKNILLIDRNARLLRKISNLERIVSMKQPKGGFELKW